MSTILAIKNSRHRDILINGTIMLHRELRLELLNDASMNGEYIVIHIHLCQEISTILDMIPNFQLISTFITAFHRIVHNTTSKPIAIIQGKQLLFILIINLIGQEIRIIQSAIVDGDNLGEVSNLNVGVRQEARLIVWIIGVGDVK